MKQPGKGPNLLTSIMDHELCKILNNKVLVLILIYTPLFYNITLLHKFVNYVKDLGLLISC